MENIDPEKDEPLTSNEMLQFEVAEAFSHFTYIASKQKLIICDMQGANGHFTDSQVLCCEKDSFGLGNLAAENDSPEALTEWLSHHKCNHVCEDFQKTGRMQLP